MKNYKKEYLVGINYFSGWWRQQPNKYHVLEKNRDWRMDYPERTALLGAYNDQETMDAEILAASSYGVDFFLFLWYVETPERHDHGTRLNNGIRQFIASPENNRMKFAIEFCNHPPFEILEDDLWEESCRTWIEAMKHPRYLHIGGKALFKVHSFHLFIKQCNNDMLLAEHRLKLLREMAEAAGVGPLLIGGGTGAEGAVCEDWTNGRNLFDFAATYMDVPNLQILNEDYTYEPLLSLAEESWKYFSREFPVPYMPYMPAGWNSHPWGDPRPCFKLPNAIEWKVALEKIKKAMDEEKNLRLPDGTLEGQKIFNIYAWNEFGEGGIMAPTIGDGYMKLEKIREVFSSL